MVRGSDTAVDGREEEEEEEAGAISPADKHKTRLLSANQFASYARHWEEKLGKS